MGELRAAMRRRRLALSGVIATAGIDVGEGCDVGPYVEEGVSAVVERVRE